MIKLATLFFNKNCLKMSLSALLLYLFSMNAPELLAAPLAPAVKANNKIFSSRQLLSLNFREIQVRDLLQLLAKIANINLVIDDTVQGSLTVSLHQVSWQQAFNTVLTMKNLGANYRGNVVFVAPLVQLAAQTQQQLNQQSLTELLITLHYANATNVATLLRSAESGLLSMRGHVQADGRTNTLWVSDVSQNMPQIHRFINSVDVPVKQVLIKARIISVDDSFVRELGLQFGTAIPVAHPGNSNNQESDGLAVDMPNAFKPGQFNLAIAHVGMNSLLDLQITALENEGHARIISSPELLTANHIPAYIESGDEIPYQEKTSSGATNIDFKKAVLSLKVTPQITVQNRILLNLEVTQDKLGAILVNGVPSIQTRAIQTQVVVQDGQTLVLGGIYEQLHQQNWVRIPVLGSLPVIGRLFSNKRTENKREELLIFVTPEVMRQTV